MVEKDGRMFIHNYDTLAQVVMKAGLCVYLFWFVDLGNACLFTAGSPVERRQWSFVKLAKPSKQKRITVTAAETDSTFLCRGKKKKKKKKQLFFAQAVI